MAWITGLVIAGLATAGKAYQANQVSKAQSNEIMQGIAQQNADEAAARAKIQANLNNFKPAKAQATTAQNQQDYLAQVQKAIGANGPYQATQALPQTVALTNQRGADAKQKDDALANLFGTISGTQQQRQNENIGTAQTGSYLGQLSDSANRQWQAKRLLASSIHANPWLSMALNFAQSYGLGAAGGAAGAAAGTGADAMTGNWGGLNVPAYAGNSSSMWGG